MRLGAPAAGRPALRRATRISHGLGVIRSDDVIGGIMAYGCCIAPFEP
jgi:hypothetical protein